VERYPRLQKVQKMLDVLDRIITEAERQGDPGIHVQITRGGDEAGVRLHYFNHDELAARQVELAEELGLSGGETVGLFRWAEAAGYIRPNYGSVGRDVQGPTASLEYLQPEGYELIGELPDPQERLALVLEAAARTVQKDAGLDPTEKKSRIDWLEEMKFVVRTFGVEAAKTVLRGELPPS
jgi:hypothetical protein